MSDQKLQEMLSLFCIEGKLQYIRAHKSGLINQTYISEWRDSGPPTCYIHQSINKSVFKNIPAMISNIAVVTEHLRKSMAQLQLASTDQTLTLVPSRQGSYYAQDQSGQFWRTYNFIPNSITYDVCVDPQQAYKAAAKLGRFHRYLTDIELTKLTETIPNFFSSPKRYADLLLALKQDTHKRSSSCDAEINLALEKEELSRVIEQAQTKNLIPSRAVHGDTKFNNILFDKDTGEAISLIDLDTCMPGYSLYDFGDLVRNTALKVAEDEQDFSKINLDLNLFGEITRGYLFYAASILTEAELQVMQYTPRLLALTLGVRFLTDYLNGDKYFRIQHPQQNLYRARTQFEIVKKIESLEPEMQKIIASFS